MTDGYHVPPSIKMDIPLDFSEGVCGAVNPDLPGVTCTVPVVKGELIHLLFNSHAAMVDGDHIAWPYVKKKVCKCHCHDCCVPIDASCEDCEDNHG